jgi:allophanate hydrolase subunit 1
MNKTDHSKCQRAIEEIKITIPNRLRVLDELLMEARKDEENCEYVIEYAKAMSDLVLDVIEHAVSHVEKVEELEAIKDRIESVDNALETAISLLYGAEHTSTNWHNEFERIMHRH